MQHHCSFGIGAIVDDCRGFKQRKITKPFFNPLISVSSEAAASLSSAIIETSKAKREPLSDLMPSDFYLFISFSKTNVKNY